MNQPDELYVCFWLRMIEVQHVQQFRKDSNGASEVNTMENQGSVANGLGNQAKKIEIANEK